ncbi:site-specific integrase [Streptomyces sp. NPDC007157]|uniref:tyrosine-type recombinase/integrase n=1 Tax=Streptomyces sp. NPDC007157 TaxID=3154681 RepID=UPI0033FC9FA7
MMLGVPDHPRRLIEACLDLHALYPDRKLRDWAHMLGFRCHFSPKSRRYSTTLGALRQVRADYRTQQQRRSLCLPDLAEESETTTLTLAHRGGAVTMDRLLTVQEVAEALGTGVHFGERPLPSITTARVRAWRTECLTRTGEPTVVKAYQILRAILNTAVDDELIRRNPCRIKGADQYDVPERPVLTVAEVFAVADSIAPRYRLLVLLAAITGLRFGELASLRRRDVDTENAALMVRRSQAEMQTGALFDKAPKSDAGVRPVAFPTELLPDVKRHLDAFAGRGRDGHVFFGPQGGRLRRSNFRDDWINARKGARRQASRSPQPAHQPQAGLGSEGP